MSHLDFTHTDQRIFTHTGKAPHTTRDGRVVNLNVWETSCTEPGCNHTITVKTATDTPTTWCNFEPARYCAEHRQAALRRGFEAWKKARDEGLARWRNSDEGKAFLAQLAANKLGSLEQAILAKIQELALVDDVWWEEVAIELYDTLPKPQGRDTRLFRLHRALQTLQNKKRVEYYGGVVKLIEP